MEYSNLTVTEYYLEHAPSLSPPAPSHPKEYVKVPLGCSEVTQSTVCEQELIIQALEPYYPY